MMLSFQKPLAEHTMLLSCAQVIIKPTYLGRKQSVANFGSQYFSALSGNPCEQKIKVMLTGFEKQREEATCIMPLTLLAHHAFCSFLSNQPKHEYQQSC